MEIKIIQDNVFKTCFSLACGGYKIEDSCLSVLVPECKYQSHKHDLIRYSEIFNKDLTLKVEEEEVRVENGGELKKIKKQINKLKISDFLRQFICSQDIVIGIMYSYLSDKYINHFDEIYFQYGLSQTALAWIFYHGLERSKLTWAIDFIGKQDCKDKCIICNATKNVEIVEDFSCYVTVSPEIYTGGRKTMSTGCDDGCHYVIWSLDHSYRFEPVIKCVRPMKYMSVYGKLNDVDMYDSFIRLDDTWPYHHGKLYTHGDYQYGHFHVHCIDGEYHNIRALETLRTIIKCVQNNEKIESSDFFHPIDKFYKNCSDSGKDIVVTSICHAKIRVKLDLQPDGVMLFYKLSFGSLFTRIEELLAS